RCRKQFLYKRVLLRMRCFKVARHLAGCGEGILPSQRRRRDAPATAAGTAALLKGFHRNLAEFCSAGQVGHLPLRGHSKNKGRENIAAFILDGRDARTPCFCLLLVTASAVSAAAKTATAAAAWAAASTSPATTSAAGTTTAVTTSVSASIGSTVSAAFRAAVGAAPSYRSVAVEVVFVAGGVGAAFHGQGGTMCGFAARFCSA